MLARHELIEVTRLIAFADVVTPVSSSSVEQERLVFKYYQHVFDIRANWNAIHIGAKLSTHPHICPVRHVIVDEIDRSRVVGFTAPFFPGGDIYETRASRPFKLKWAKQLFQTLDDLHLKYGVYHGDVSSHNMVIDPATDILVLIDFGCSGKIGTPFLHWHHRAALSPEVPHNPLYDIREHQPVWAIAHDMQSALITVWGLITGAKGNILVSSEVRGRIIVDNSTIREGGWARHPDVKLDSPVEDYYKVTMDWLRERNTGVRITEHHQASEPLNYPDYMPPPQVDIDAHMRKEAKEQAAKEAREAKRHAKEQVELCNMASQQGGKLASNPVPLEDMRFHIYVDSVWEAIWLRDVQGDRGATSGRDFLRVDAIEAGCPFLNWERPSTAQLDHSRRLLASGKYEDECTSANIMTNKRKRKDRVEVESRDEGDNNSGNADSDETASGGNTDVTTKRITRSAKKQANTATPPAPKPTRKVAAPKPTRKAAVPKRAGKATASKLARKAESQD
ncbi:hypothetical protein NKR19_g1682 [Coniochaeta hoffmannii]|uniref:EKC/KEOPS complex subunit BUD32 n=1 Tax=Coniochaeta hoffmannii TaxID=91930 RepID=A0AA38SBY4_9PEZI|nr:hypothetical protein NKR19_g1682 [Coniochaeta hoffmannii]